MPVRTPYMPAWNYTDAKRRPCYAHHTPNLKNTGSDWAVGETGAAGPTGNRNGAPPGHTCIAVVGEGVEDVVTVETRVTDRYHAYSPSLCVCVCVRAPHVQRSRS